MIHFGIVGTNWITHAFIAGAHDTGNWTLRAVYSRKAETAHAFASKYAGLDIAIYTDLDALARDTAISTVYIASPNILHYSQAKRLLTAGKHVVVEKPACSTVPEADDLFETARQHHVYLLEAFRHLQEPNFKLLKRALPRLGPIYGASLTYAQYSSRYDAVLHGERPNIFNLEMGGGALADLGVYCVAAAIDLFGAPKASRYWPVKIATGADGAGRLMLTYENFVVHLCHSKIYNSDAPSEIYGEKGTLSVPTLTDVESVVFWEQASKEKRLLEGVVGKQALNLKAEADVFARIIEGRDGEAVGRMEEVSREVVRVLEAARRENGLLFPGEK